MGKLIKNHWARLIILSAAAYQVIAAIECFFYPKIFWDFLTRSLDGAVKPVPALQIINLILGLGMLCLEWPLNFVAGTAFHRSLELRLAIIPLTALSAALIYQGTNSAIYYLIGMVVYFWGYSEGEEGHRTSSPANMFWASIFSGIMHNTYTLSGVWRSHDIYDYQYYTLYERSYTEEWTGS
ncbi:pro41 protein [Fusarium flagelliforme]|uniref:Pro41 protein n=1 Tax=Fusarium flagelliforme TaxID=2675880 RepID=A0A395MUQ4_9HYPO|nr:pro41 protein [Fusarium flagelliforme]